MSIPRLLLLCSLAFTMGASLASAEAVAAPVAGSTAKGPGGGGRGKMVEACQEKKQGHSCKVDGPRAFEGKCTKTPRGPRAFEGKCTKTPRGKLACMNPEMRARVKEGRAKAKEACKGKRSGASCSFTVGSRAIDGSCFDAPAGRLCRPADGARG
jgi:hypothetical protein